MTTLVDTHCHLDFNTFDEDRGAMLARARQAGVVRMLNPGIDLASSQAAIRLAEEHEAVYAACGVHPNDGQRWKSDTKNQLRTLARHPKVRAIGEIGLDYYRDRTPREMQKHIFQEQLDLASEIGLPVVIHCRQAVEDVLAMLAAWRAGLVAAGSPLADRPGVLHSFSEDGASAHRAVEMGFFIGFTGPLTFQKAQELREVAASLPLERILVETDAPFLTPHPHRGKRNEPAHVRWVAEKVAELHRITAEKAAEQIYLNSCQLFNW
ncbi:MAG: TatD family hydrolase [Chloroflexi bacterium]|nr:TatD family hydrolase [Chloroflexota bacterium]